jgi:2-C-methyl-D-erythritol 4-phosphate cytidylyltransferase
MGFDKLTAPLAGKNAVHFSLSAFQSCPDVARIVLVCPCGREEEFGGYASGYSKVVGVVPGGVERSDSVRAGAEVLVRNKSGSEPFSDSDGIVRGGFVAVHDVARPLIRPESIRACLEVAREVGAAALAERLADTLHCCAEDGTVLGTVPRENLWRVQTPQILKLTDLLVLEGRSTDEVSALQKVGRRAVLLENPFPNFKLTVPGDVILAEAVLNSRLP